MVIGVEFSLFSRKVGGAVAPLLFHRFLCTCSFGLSSDKFIHNSNQNESQMGD